MTDPVDIDVAIVGAGIMGLWTAYEILKKHPHINLAVFERELYLGEHTTSRNSEVLHAGIYYANGSLKHRHCIAGNALWREFVREFELPFLDCGKFIVAQKDQSSSLEKLYSKAIQNGVPGIREANKEEIQRLRTCLDITQGLYSPSSAVLDVSSSLKCLRRETERLGGHILIKNEVTVDDFQSGLFKLRINGDPITSRFLINCGGLFALQFRRQMGLEDLENYFVKGNYLQLNEEYPLKNLIYPIPPADGLGLGVHLTLDISGGAKFGPNTEPISEIDYAVSSQAKQQMFPEIKRLFFNVRPEKLTPGYSGIRPKVKKDGQLLKDFLIQSKDQHNIDGYIELLGIESPGLTAAPSLAKSVAGLIDI